jgi:hypothetical protein
MWRDEVATGAAAGRRLAPWGKAQRVLYMDTSWLGTNRQISTHMSNVETVAGFS